MSRTPILEIAAGAIAVCALILLSRRRRRLPPGPRGLPIVGNIFDLPPPETKPWLHWEKHKEKYGPLSSVTVLGQTIIIVNDHSIALDLLDRHSAAFSDRPKFPFGGRMAGYEKSFPCTQYDDRHKRYRRTFHKYFGAGAAIERFALLESVEIRRLLLRLIREPDSLDDQLRRMVATLILEETHGYNVGQEGNDRLVELADQVMQEFAVSIEPGRWAVDIVPALRYLPDWFPGTSFKRTAKSYKRNLYELCEKPFAYVLSQLDAGKARPSFVATMLSDAKTERDHEIIKWCAAAAYGGGVDTTVSALYTFFLAMTLYPDVQRRAQKELDEVVGKDCFPTLADRPKLPYINAVIKESMRWQLTAPLALPHVSTEDIEYDGYLIPKGSMLMANGWVTAHDPERYSDSMEFKPERFLDINEHESELDSYKFAFGYGRRVCPGKDFADALIWLTIAMSLTVLDVSKARDKAGNEIIPEIKFGSDLVTRAERFPCSITARSEHAAMVASSVESEHPHEPSDAEAFAAIPWTPPT